MKKKNKIYDEKERINDILNSESFNESLKRTYEIINRQEEYTEITIKIVSGFILPSLKNLKYYLEDNNIEKTSNKIENIFQKVLSKHDKKIMKTDKGIIKRISLKIEYWDYNNFLENSR